jgi:mannose-6-phosphate isomerase-like protein (cupin superfamily)
MSGVEMGTMTITAARKFGMLPLIIFACLLQGADLPGFKLYRAAELAAKDKELAPQDAKDNLTFVVLDKSPETALIRRAGTGDAEQHDNLGDILVIRFGEATLVIGGKLDQPRSVGPGEYRAASIVGGEKRTIGPGDIIHIPAKMPHHVLITRGQTVSYVIVKVKE